MRFSCAFHLRLRKIMKTQVRLINICLQKEELIRCRGRLLCKKMWLQFLLGK